VISHYACVAMQTTKFTLQHMVSSASMSIIPGRILPLELWSYKL